MAYVAPIVPNMSISDSRIKEDIMNMTDHTGSEREQSPLFEPGTPSDYAISSTSSSGTPIPQVQSECAPPQTSSTNEMSTLDGDDDEDMIPGHDCSNEEMPRCPIYAPEYQIVKNGIHKIAELLREPLSASSYTDGNVEGLKQELKKRRKARFPEQVRVALVGDMAAGKSSLVNSLLGVGVLARKGDLGQSCTWVVQEFTRTLPKQSKPFRAEIEYYDMKEREAVFSGLFKEAHAAVSVERDTDSDIQELNEEHGNRSLAGHSAIQTLTALFKQHPECGSEGATKAFLAQASSPAGERNIIKTMQLWSETVLSRYTEDSASTIVEASTPQDLLQQLRQYTFNAMDEEEVEDEDPSPWPLIKKIKFGLSSSLLDDGVILVDLPGLRDVNRVRFRTVNKALSDCTHYLVVANIARAQDDETITKYLTEGYTKKGSGRAFVVCTSSDVIEENQMRPRNAREGEKLLDSQDTVERLRKEFKQLQNRMKTAKRGQRLQLYDDMAEMEAKIFDAVAAHTEHRITMRSKKVIKSLKRDYDYLTGDSCPLAVFCVSNKAYERYQTGYEPSLRPELSLEATQIPALRKHLRLATGRGRFNDAVFHVETALPSLLVSFELWCAKTHLKRKEELEEIVIEPLEAFPPIAQELFRKLEIEIRTKILLPMKAREPAWIVKAGALCQKWRNEFKNSTYLSHLRRKGFRKGTKAKPEVSWNNELTQIMVPDLVGVFDGLMKMCNENEEPLGAELDELLESVKEKIKADPQASLMALSPFLKKIDLERPVLQHAVDKCFKLLRRRITEIIVDATTDTDNSIVGACMEHVYESTSRITGQGSGLRRPAAMFKNLTRVSGFWMSVHDEMRRRFSEVLSMRLVNFSKDVKSVLTHIHESFNACCQDKEVEDPDEKVLREQLSQNVAKAREVLDGSLTEAMQECRAWV